jgi:ABC-2 type transport system ATP-binding protein
MTPHRDKISHATTPIPPLARLVGASKRYGDVLALDQVNLDIRPGEVLSVLGPNGAGKTTALALLMGLRQPDLGRAELFGGDPGDPRVRQKIGVMLQSAALPEALRVDELVHLQSSYYPAPRPLAETLSLAGLEPLAARRYSALSGGQQRRVQFALAICGNPALLFVDEPTVGLDVEARRGFWAVLRQLRADGASIVLTTHYLEEADALADRIVLLAEGRVLADDTPAGIKSRAAGKRVRCVTAVPLAELAGWAEVEAATEEGGITELRTYHAERLLSRLLALDPGITGLEVLPLSLEEAFVSLIRSPLVEETA